MNKQENLKFIKEQLEIDLERAFQKYCKEKKKINRAIRVINKELFIDGAE